MIRKCYREYGVNHYQHCQDIKKEYVEMVSKVDLGAKKVSDNDARLPVSRFKIRANCGVMGPTDSLGRVLRELSGAAMTLYLLKAKLRRCMTKGMDGLVGHERIDASQY